MTTCKSGVWSRLFHASLGLTVLCLTVFLIAQNRVGADLRQRMADLQADVQLSETRLSTAQTALAEMIRSTRDLLQRNIDGAREERIAQELTLKDDLNKGGDRLMQMILGLSSRWTEENKSTQAHLLQLDSWLIKPERPTTEAAACCSSR